MTMRKITSLTATLSFVLMVTTSIILYLVPPGRVAYWADWRMWGLTKTQWGDIHINVGLLFLLALGLHIYYNWKPLMAYLKDRTRQMKVFTAAFNVALTVCVLTVAGTLFAVPPFSWVLDFNTALKDAGAEKYGEPPYGHAELSSLNSFAKKMDIDAAAARQRLEAAGFQVTGGDQTLQAMAAINGTTPKVLYAVMQGGPESTPRKKGLPDTAPPGTGRLTLAEICDTYGLDSQTLIASLETKNIRATVTDSLRDIADRHGMGPTDLYATIKSVASPMQ
ncbi:DUF4405 domain-containing protein [uncultured Desulfosarcina sp.]|uniref:DUF4405 domain-containing protein n=1 Tax=uncultured Desulfosarcina sp. TaxID=218289 RepID=UPI0029C7BC26|nr:DUF4405 domain-containing protein [uncultured Desulfosarcina sp.]